PWHPGALLFERLLWSNSFRYPVTPGIWRANAKFFWDSLHVTDKLPTGLKQDGNVRTCYFRHHLAHAASAYYPSPFSDCAYLTIDGSGELETITWGRGEGATIRQLGRVMFPH